MASTLRAPIRRHPLLSFFVLAYAIMTGVTLVHLLLVPLPFGVLWFLQVFSPSFSALAVSGLCGGLPEVRRLLAGFTRWKVGVRWYLAATLLLSSPLVLAGVYIALGNAPRGISAGVTPLMLLGYFVFNLFSGPLSEEAGWRGFALPRLQERHSAFKASLILGLLWWGWHIPLYFVPGSSQSGIPVPIYLVLIILLSVFFTWIYNNTGGSLVMTALAHFSFNLAGAFVAGYLGLLPAMVVQVAGGVFLTVAVVAILLIFGPEHLAHKPLPEPLLRRGPSQPPVAGTGAR